MHRPRHVQFPDATRSVLLPLAASLGASVYNENVTAAKAALSSVAAWLLHALLVIAPAPLSAIQAYHDSLAGGFSISFLLLPLLLLADNDS